jgi:4-hydroxymandelate oxidase
MMAPAEELANSLEFETAARTVLNSETFALIAGGDRSAFERITFRPRMMIDTTGLDLSMELLGTKFLSPIMAAPVADLRRFHKDGEAAWAKGALAAQAPMVVSANASLPLKEIAAQAGTNWWFQIYADAGAGGNDRIREAVQAGCKAVVITGEGAEWAAIDQLRRGVSVPLVLKGVMTPADAQAAMQHGFQAVIVSLPGALPGIVDSVAGRIPVLVDGGFRRGSDVLKALATGAKAVLLARPVVWALAAYGSDGVRTVIELIQSELARDMAMCGKVNLQALDRTLLKMHAAR